jgi:hypothetical protein
MRLEDLILRSLHSKRLEGWPQRMDSRPSFETPRKERGILRMRLEARTRGRATCRASCRGTPGPITPGVGVTKDICHIAETR